MKDSQQGFVLYFDSLNALSRQMKAGLISAEDAFSVIAALGEYAKSGQVPENSALTPVASMAFEMMRIGVRKSLDKYAERRQKNAEAARSRWSAGNKADENACAGVQSHGDACNQMQTHANACERMNRNANDGDIEIEHEHDVEEETSYIEPNADIPTHEEIVRNQLAMQLIDDYKLPDSPKTLDALLCDMEQHGEAAVQSALENAALHNSRERISVTYYRAFLGDQAKSGRARAAPVYQEINGKSYYEGLECLE